MFTDETDAQEGEITSRLYSWDLNTGGSYAELALFGRLPLS
jgi:hypothetical protein